MANPGSLPNLKSLVSAVTEIIKGTLKFWGAPVAQDYGHFSSGCDNMMGLGKPQQHAKVEISSFSRCRNIKILGSSPSPGPRARFFKFEIASFSCCENITGKPQNFRELH